MPRVSEFSVIFDEAVLEWIPERQIKKYPHETGMFLFGEHWSSRFNIPYIKQASEAANSEHTTGSWEFYQSEVLRQTRLAANSGNTLLGFTHSHPWKHPLIGINNQSITDARIQIENRFTVSLIVGLWERDDQIIWWPTCWKEGFAAPLDILVKSEKGQLITLKKWYYKKYGSRPWYFIRS